MSKIKYLLLNSSLDSFWKRTAPESYKKENNEKNNFFNFEKNVFPQFYLTHNLISP